MFKKSILSLALAILSMGVFAQTDQSNDNAAYNAADKLLASDTKLSIGGYAQIDYNQPIVDGQYSNGKLDVHRLVLLFGYQFSDKTKFVSELEFEHVKEVYVEQAFINHEFKSWLNFRGGLMLVPMGIINEYHEPAIYNGVERPNLDSKIVPTTWREIGAGFTGRFDNASLKYQLYVMNGFNGYDDGGKFRGTVTKAMGRSAAITVKVARKVLSHL